MDVGKNICHILVQIISINLNKAKLFEGSFFWEGVNLGGG